MSSIPYPNYFQKGILFDFIFKNETHFFYNFKIIKILLKYFDVKRNSFLPINLWRVILNEFSDLNFALVYIRFHSFNSNEKHLLIIFLISLWSDLFLFIQLIDLQLSCTLLNKTFINSGICVFRWHLLNKWFY